MANGAELKEDGEGEEDSGGNQYRPAASQREVALGKGEGAESEP